MNSTTEHDAENTYSEQYDELAELAHELELEELRMIDVSPNCGVIEK